MDFVAPPNHVERIFAPGAQRSTQRPKLLQEGSLSDLVGSGGREDAVVRTGARHRGRGLAGAPALVASRQRVEDAAGRRVPNCDVE